MQPFVSSECGRAVLEVGRPPQAAFHAKEQRVRTVDERSLTDLTEMAIDELWDLHQSIAVILAAKLENQKNELDKRLAQLHANGVGAKVGAKGGECSRRPYPTVNPKFRNPARPDQTWSGRGKRPRWLTELLNAGLSIRDFQIREVTASQV